MHCPVIAGRQKGDVMGSGDTPPGRGKVKEAEAASSGPSAGKRVPGQRTMKPEELAISPAPNPREEVLLRIRAAEREAAQRRKAAEERAARILAEARKRADELLESAEAEGRKMMRGMVDECIARNREERARKLEEARAEASRFREAVGSTSEAVDMVIERLRREHGVQA